VTVEWKKLAFEIAASTTVAGQVELATDAETVTGADTTRATVPSNLVAKMAAPGAIGSTTPGTGKFTTLETTGLITVTGGQIKFPATAVPSSDANTLDDYEEGTYTPTITCSTSGTITLNTSYDTLSYVKIGSFVEVHGRIIVSSVSSPVGYFYIDLPFPRSGPGELSYNFSGGITMYGTVAANVSDFVLMGGEGNTVRVYLGTSTTLSGCAEEVKAATNMIFSFSYRA
jgi:hypothetical protein